MWPRAKLIVWWLVSAAVVAVVTSWAVLRWHVRSQHEPPASGRASEAGMHEWLRSHASLAQEKQEALHALEAHFAKAEGPLRQAIRSAEHEIAAAMRDGEEKSPRLAAALEQLTAAQTQLRQAAVHQYFAVQKLLDPAPRAAFAQWNYERLVRP